MSDRKKAKRAAPTTVEKLQEEVKNEADVMFGKAGEFLVINVSTDDFGYETAIKIPMPIPKAQLDFAVGLVNKEYILNMVTPEFGGCDWVPGPTPGVLVGAPDQDPTGFIKKYISPFYVDGKMYNPNTKKEETVPMLPIPPGTERCPLHEFKFLPATGQSVIGIIPIHQN